MYDKLKAILGRIESELSKIHPDPIFNPYNIYVRIKEILQSKHPEIYQEWKEKGFDKNHPFLFKKGVKEDKPDDEYATLLHIAACNGNIKVIKTLVAQGANVNAKDNKGRTPLHWAAFNGHKDVVQALLNVQGIDVHAEDKNKQTPLHWATDEWIVNALIAQGAKVNAEDKNKQTPLHWAVKDCNTAVIWALINNNAEVNAKDKNKQTPLHLAVKGGNTAVIWSLIDNKAKVNAKDKNKQIPLHWAASGKVARYLIIQGAEVNAIDNDENTPLHLAAEKGYITVIKALLDKEANIHAKNKAGRTPLYYSANVDIKNALIAAGAKDVPVAEVHSKDKEDIPLQGTTMEGNADIHSEDGNTHSHSADGEEVVKVSIESEEEEEEEKEVNSEDGNTHSQSANVETDTESGEEEKEVNSEGDEETPLYSADGEEVVKVSIESEEEEEEEKEVNPEDGDTHSHSADGEETLSESTDAEAEVNSEGTDTHSQSADGEETLSESADKADNASEDVHIVAENSSQRRKSQDLAGKSEKEQLLETAEKIYYLIPIIIGISVCLVTAALGIRVAALLTTTENLPIKQFSMTPAIIVIIAIALITGILAYEAFKPSTQVDEPKQNNLTALLEQAP